MSAKGNIVRYITTMVMGRTCSTHGDDFLQYMEEIGRLVPADANVSAYFEQHSGHDCRFDGTWHDWERDEWMTLGCLKVKDEHREGSYSSATGPRAISQVSMQGTYRIDGEGFIHIAGKDSEGKNHDISAPISVEDDVYPTQVCFAETTEGIACIAFFIWKNLEDG